MLKTIRSSDLILRERKAVDNEVVGSGGEVDNKNLPKSKKSKNAKSGIMSCINTGAMGKLIFFIQALKRFLSNWD